MLRTSALTLWLQDLDICLTWISYRSRLVLNFQCGHGMFCYLCSAYMLSPLFLDRVLQFVEAWHRGRKGSESAGIHLSAVRPGL